MTKLRTLLAPAVHIAIHKVVDHLDIISDVQLTHGSFFQIL